ncbi:unnamed protein product [Ectocarpus sp. 12 AP-2014]
MSAKRRSLGKGLDALLSGSGGATAAPSSGSLPAASGDGELRDIPVEQISRGRYQPRRDFDQGALEELAASIKAQGLMQPIVVRPLGEAGFEIIAGERRWRATQLAGLPEISALVRDISDEAAIAMALIENIQREDLNPIEEAVALARLQEEYELTQQEVADAVGKSRSTIANLLRLLALQPEVRLLLEHGDIEMGHARCLLGLEGQLQVQASREVVSRGLSVRQVEALVRQYTKGSAEQPAEKIDPDIRRLQDELTEKVGSPVLIQHGAGGKGKLVVKYSSLDELDGILAHLR